MFARILQKVKAKNNLKSSPPSSLKEQPNPTNGGLDRASEDGVADLAEEVSVEVEEFIEEEDTQTLKGKHQLQNETDLPSKAKADEKIEAEFETKKSKKSSKSSACNNGKKKLKTKKSYRKRSRSKLRHEKSSKKASSRTRSRSSSRSRRKGHSSSKRSHKRSLSRHDSRHSRSSGRRHGGGDRRRRKSRSPFVTEEEKLKLLEIAKANVLRQYQADATGQSLSAMAVRMSHGASIAKLTEVCKDMTSFDADHLSNSSSALNSSLLVNPLMRKAAMTSISMHSENR